MSKDLSRRKKAGRGQDDIDLEGLLRLLEQSAEGMEATVTWNPDGSCFIVWNHPNGRSSIVSAPTLAAARSESIEATSRIQAIFTVRAA